MNNLDSTSKSWSLGKWFFVIGLFVSGQFLFLEMLPEPPSSSSTLIKSPPASLTIFQSAPVKDGEVSVESLMDPTLFALANSKGYSSESWLSSPEIENEFSRWNPTEEWLASEAFYPTTNNEQTPLFDTAQQLSLIKKFPVAESNLAAPAAPERSFITFEPELTQRKIKALPDLQTWESTSMLQPTFVQLLINERGSTISAIVITGSGNVAADLKAVELSKKMNFSPTHREFDGTRKSHTDSLRVYFHWATIPPPPQPEPEPAEL